MCDFNVRLLPALGIIFCGSVLLSGCGWFGSHTVSEIETPTLTPLVSYMAEHHQGDRTVLDDPEFGAGIQVTMQEEFISASGEPCKRAALMANQYESEIAVICRGGDKQWKLAPRIWGQGIRP